MSGPVVLVVDDEPLLRMVAGDTLEDSGFVTIEAGEAEEALAILQNHPEINVLFTDIHMPGRLDGLELARKVNELRPDIQLIVTSGRARPTADEIPDHGAFIEKPYDAKLVAWLITAIQRPRSDGSHILE